ncbi:sensor histidine kinase NtrY-like [Pelagibacterium halotolerans]|uniref:sensor histidine kinase NtrY-like n=1 Tax=Pelagibacterium halotolerans TaxID=531813 RepID=UPI0008983D54|nr:PAS domain-containing sensor histidine kinase [Pelagibacterium halotolerans]QJR18739.1 PAS domain-containing sensor histidine kinase [Pelagibacterium halotolerans]SEA12946.1 PAS/PAC sensor signal transduction histidine kinase [Pelagibacterium halotolerans]
MTASAGDRQISQSRDKPAPLFNDNRLLRQVGFVVVLISVVVATGSFLIMSGATDIEPGPDVWTWIWIANAILITLVVALVLTELVMLVQARIRRQEGARLQVRIVAMFAIVAAGPAFIVAVVATLSLNQGLDQWFSERMRSMVESSRLVARSYMLEHAQVLRDDTIWVASELETARDSFTNDAPRFQRILTALATTRSLPFTSLVNQAGETVMRAQINIPGAVPRVPDAVLEAAGEGAPTLIAPGSTSSLVGAVVKLRGYDDLFLFVARPVDPEVLEYVRLTDENITEYRLYDSSRLVFQITFALMYVGVAFVFLLAALWIGIALANGLIDPIRNLMIASNRVSRGDLDVQLPVPERGGDLHDLAVRFNKMTAQLRNQRAALVAASRTNDQRRQFTEAVVEGVSAGIIGLDAFGRITLVNSRACAALGQTELDLMNQELAHIAPELAPTVERAQSARRGRVQDQVQLSTGFDRRTYQVRLTREGTITESKGFVVTLDDITELVAAQRNSAWADVARRIAHEIKNPLTPIQLSAERLRRRYANKLVDDFDVFDKCISTIVRQVGDIGRMVDEFSSFARMPSAAIVRADLSDTVRQAVFLESVRQPEINIKAQLPEETVYAQFDTRLVSQALTNLIKNAVEAIESVGLDSIENPEVVVSVSTSGDEAVIEVSDNGKGWPEENRHQLLEPYMTTREKGTGLGLAIVAKIIEQHGGRVDLRDASPDSNGRVGACFAFTLPLQESGKQPVEPQGGDQSNEKTTQEETSRVSAMAVK